MINKGSRYPIEGPHMMHSESTKMNKFLSDYKVLRTDAFVTN
jgi:hypothetical protein